MFVMVKIEVSNKYFLTRGSNEFCREEEIFKASKDRKTAIREEKMKRDRFQGT